MSAAAATDDGQDALSSHIRMSAGTKSTTDVDEVGDFRPMSCRKASVSSEEIFSFASGVNIGAAAIWNGDTDRSVVPESSHTTSSSRRDDVEPRFYVYFLQSGLHAVVTFPRARATRRQFPNLSRNRLAASVAASAS